MIKDIFAELTKITFAVLVALLIWALFSLGFQHTPMKQTIASITNNEEKIRLTMPRGTDFNIPLISDKPVSFKGKIKIYYKHKLIFQKNISDKQAWHTKNEQNKEMYVFGRFGFFKQFQTYDIVYQFEYIDKKHKPTIILWWADCRICGYI